MTRCMQPFQRWSRWATTLGMAWLMVAGFAASGAAKAANFLSLPVVKPVISCDQMAKADVTSAVDGTVTITSTKILNTTKGQFCVVNGNIAPSIGFRIDLPIDHWTQRYFQGGCGGLCGSLSVGIDHASGCLPALNGEFAVGGDDMGHESSANGSDDAAFAADPQKRIDFAYRGNHDTALVAKALIKIFYGQSPKYSYFIGCSDGGREALEEAQRFPTDFNGIAAGDPDAMFVIQNSFYYAWNALSDRRADGTNILTAAKLQLLHAAVIAHCDTLSGVKDGLLVDPSACNFDPASIACPNSAADTSACLTPDELSAVRAQYSGANDGKGHTFSFGAAKGSEMLWALSLPPAPIGTSTSIEMATRLVQQVILPRTDLNYDVAHFQFTEATFKQMTQTAPLYDALNTDLKPYAAHGGKLILYQGISDTLITPGDSIAYFEGVQKFIGKAATDKFLRFFLIPGMWHCGGGDGYSQFDLLSPLMAWTEMHQAPAELLTSKLAVQTGAGYPGGHHFGGARADSLIAQPVWGRLVASRPAFPYPYIPHYTGKGDPNDAVNYVPMPSPAGEMKFSAGNEALKLIGPDNQKFYHVVNNKLISDD